ncbi:hypothetical protein BDA96_03G134800 [Sorghum bicolor]|uniref:Uncharacterized protein n=2 Tax=Sorghum bicolor TaxID=4558 RepID=A0A921RCN1_SORBI|nr:hypothetical protein BDA96_03G134800 [Sorghum bicolor]OQU86694.1 hypothetical protein SORBI_3003G128850 [Sorghum bicolor]
MNRSSSNNYVSVTVSSCNNIQQHPIHILALVLVYASLVRYSTLHLILLTEQSASRSLHSRPKSANLKKTIQVYLQKQKNHLRSGFIAKLTLTFKSEVYMPLGMQVGPFCWNR